MIIRCGDKTFVCPTATIYITDTGNIKFTGRDKAEGKFTVFVSSTEVDALNVQLQRLIKRQNRRSLRHNGNGQERIGIHSYRKGA